MRTILDGRYAPASSAAGFVDAPLADVAGAFAQWRRGLGRAIEVRDVSGFPGLLAGLGPPNDAREVLVETRSGWTAYFNNWPPYPDIVSPLGHITRTMRRRGVAVRCTPGDDASYGALQFELLAAEDTEFLNIVRAIDLTEDGGRWSFGADGTVQPFEETDRYRARRVRDRFTPDMLARYCSALGIELFDPGWYGPAGVLVVETGTT